MKLKIFDNNHLESGSFTVNDKVFSVSLNPVLVHQYLCAELAGKRQGTVGVKGRGDVAASNKKPWSQKGLGRARAGSVASPIWRGGGVVFGPVARSYRFKVSRKAKRVCMCSLLSEFVKKERFSVLEKISFNALETKTPLKTKSLLDFVFKASLAKSLYSNLKNDVLKKKLMKYKLVFIVDENSSELKKAGKNIPWLKCLTFNRLNIRDLFYADEIIIEKHIVQKLEEFFLGGACAISKGHYRTDHDGEIK